jgi:mRNA interferase MazF
MIVLSPDFILARTTVFLAVPLTSQKTERVYAFEALVEPPDGGLTKRSKALLLHVRAIDSDQIIGRLGTVSRETMARIEEALRIAAGLTPIE